MLRSNAAPRRARRGRAARRVGSSATAGAVATFAAHRRGPDLRRREFGWPSSKVSSSHPDCRSSRASCAYGAAWCRWAVGSVFTSEKAGRGSGVASELLRRVGRGDAEARHGAVAALRVAPCFPPRGSAGCSGRGRGRCGSARRERSPQLAVAASTHTTSLAIRRSDRRWTNALGVARWTGRTRPRVLAGTARFAGWNAAEEFLVARDAGPGRIEAYARASLFEGFCAILELGRNEHAERLALADGACERSMALRDPDPSAARAGRPSAEFRRMLLVPTHDDAALDAALAAHGVLARTSKNALRCCVWWTPKRWRVASAKCWAPAKRRVDAARLLPPESAGLLAGGSVLSAHLSKLGGKHG